MKYVYWIISTVTLNEWKFVRMSVIFEYRVEMISNDCNWIQKISISYNISANHDYIMSESGVRWWNKLSEILVMSSCVWWEHSETFVRWVVFDRPL